MRIKRELIDRFVFQKNQFISKVVRKVEDERHILQRHVNDILDEVGDILHDDLRFRNKIINTALIKQKFRKRIVLKFLAIIAKR